MPPPPGLRSVASAALLCNVGVERGVPLEQLLRGTGLTPKLLGDPTAEVEAAQEAHIARNLLGACPTPGLGLQAGIRYHLSMYGIWGFALISSPTVGAAIDLGLRYFDMTFAFTAMSLEVKGDEARFVIDSDTAPPDLAEFFTERDGAAAMTLLRSMLSAPVSLSRLELARPAPADPLPYAEIFGVAPVFGAGRTVAVVPADLLARPLPQADEQTARICEEQCLELLRRRTARKGMAGQVRDRLLRGGELITSADEAASRLNISSRTLRRRLAEEGTTFRTLLDETRQGLAEELLASGLTVTEVSRRLGYSEPAGFNHAFRRWTGLAPSHYTDSV